ncbi:carbohydrate ABC transporter permease [Thermofilum pendens]|uniref:Binding-protein-dependent transport systems inner membrane component n=1 Tax=Thermofilum pendens (strain DSM 2475 / Hrk 5) TaxID=368408 RepID=A1S0K4_THEPD|nr:sugar ABC transporter permease [Thermofilum pendens]ABL78984.1 binding-protein-dependent transport systems inner membrane component [Thermofilum pendens Hrk 5]
MKNASTKDLLVFLGIPLSVILVFVVYPIVATVVLSFTADGALSAKNYVEVLTESIPLKALLVANPGPYPPWGALVHNALWIVIAVPAVVFLGMLLAYTLRGVPGSSFIAGAIFLGMVLPGVVSGLIIRFMFDDSLGIFPRIFGALGVPLLSKTWTIYPQTALLALILGSVWLWLGFSVTLYLAGLDSIPSSMVEAALVDGASQWEIFTRIIVPQLKPITVVVTLMTVMWILKIFDIVYVVTGGGPGGSSTVLALIMYTYFASSLEYGKAAAVAVILALLTLVPAYWYIRMILSGEKR